MSTKCYSRKCQEKEVKEGLQQCSIKNCNKFVHASCSRRMVLAKGGDEEAAAKFYSLSQKEQNQKMLEAIDNGDVDLDNIVGAALLSGGFDMASGYLTAV